MRISFLLWIFVVFIFGCAKKQIPVATKTTGLIKVLSYNIHHANPPSKTGVIDINAIARVINAEQPSLVALQEVDVKTKRSGVNLDQAAELGRLTGLKATFFKAIDYDGGQYGLAILSKYPVESTRLYQLPTEPGTKAEPRILATAVVKVNGKQLLFACTHLDAQRGDTNRVLQTNEIVKILRAQRLPVIVAGDLNAAPGSTVITMMDQFLTRSCTTCAYTIPVLNPSKTIDFIYYKGVSKMSDQQAINEIYASDHLPVQATFQLR